MNLDDVDELRFYSREFIREFGFLNEDKERDELNFAQIHLLLECERHGVIEQNQLARNLRVNKSYICRLVKSLMNLGYISLYETGHDKRNKPIILTAAGLMKVGEINKQARNQVLSALHYLIPDEQLKVREGMKLYSSALKKARNLQGIVIRPIEKKDNGQLCILIKTVLSEFGANKPGFAYTDAETNSMFEFYQAKGSAYFVAEKNNKLLGGIGYAPLQGASSEICELRKMYLDREVRGLGLGNELLRVAIEKAALMYKDMYIETLSRMAQAISLYRKIGFEFLSQPMGETGHFSCDTWMLKKLRSN